jgi:transglutaminase-like putative cysteine protease
LEKGRTLFFVILVASLFTPFVSGLDEGRYIYRLTYTFDNEGFETHILEQDDYTLPLFINNSWQTATILNSSTPFTVGVIDDDGNKGIIMNIQPDLTPGATLSYSVEYLIESTEREKPEFILSEAERLDEIPSILISQYTGATETFQAEDATILETATKAAGNHDSVLGIVSNLIEYVTKNTTYCNFETPRYPLQTLGDNLGDCDDQSILLISMCRSLGIPAYLKVGIVISPTIQDTDTSWEGHLTNNADGVGWHGWAMIYIPPWGWIPVDLTLISEDTGLEYIINSPEYEVNLIEAIDVSEQAYIGNTLATRNRIINSTIYVTIDDYADQIFNEGLVTETYLMAFIGIAFLLAIFMMFRVSNKD